MRVALADGDVSPDEVDYVNAHGTATELNDINETRAMKTVFGDHARRLAISATKSMTGHLLGGAGGIETVFTALTLYHGIIPPTINYETQDPECDLDYVPNKGRDWKVDVAISNSASFGGKNSSIVIRKFSNDYLN